MHIFLLNILVFVRTRSAQTDNLCITSHVWWWGRVLGSAAGEGVNTQLPGDRHSCQIISGRTIGRVIRSLFLLPNYVIVFYLDSEPGVFKG